LEFQIVLRYRGFRGFSQNQEGQEKEPPLFHGLVQDLLLLEEVLTRGLTFPDQKEKVNVQQPATLPEDHCAQGITNRHVRELLHLISNLTMAEKE
jgi:hypothetical protein